LCDSFEATLTQLEARLFSLRSETEGFVSLASFQNKQQISGAKHEMDTKRNKAENTSIFLFFL
jgi:hypothetical protein